MAKKRKAPRKLKTVKAKVRATSAKRAKTAKAKTAKPKRKKARRKKTRVQSASPKRGAKDLTRQGPHGTKVAKKLLAELAQVRRELEEVRGGG